MEGRAPRVSYTLSIVHGLCFADTRSASLHFLDYIQPSKQRKLGEHGDNKQGVDEDHEIIIGKTAFRKLPSKRLDWIIGFSNASLHDRRATLAVAQMGDAIGEIGELRHGFKIAAIRA